MKIKVLFSLSLLLLIGQPAWGATIVASGCTASAVSTAIASASTGDTVQVNGPCSSPWTSSTVSVNKAVYVIGGVGGTVTITPGNGDNGAFSLDANNSRVSGFTFSGTARAIASQNGVTNAVIDNNIFTTTTGSELIFVWGPSDSWSNDSPKGTSGNIFIEHNTFTRSSGYGEAFDINADGVVVVRYNNFTNLYVDGHGVWSNSRYTPPSKSNHSFRWMEIYNNSFNVSGWASIEIRGGTGLIFNNVMVDNGEPVIYLREHCTFYGANGNCTTGVLGGTTGYCCKGQYPCWTQVGSGKITAGVQTSEPMYLWNNLAGTNQVVGYTTAHGYVAYVIVPNGMPSADAVTACGEDIPGYTGAGQTFGDITDIIQENRDYFVSATKPSAQSTYNPYTCPHPLVGAGSCNSSVAGTSGYTVNPTSYAPFIKAP